MKQQCISVLFILFKNIKFKKKYWTSISSNFSLGKISASAMFIDFDNYLASNIFSSFEYCFLPSRYWLLVQKVNNILCEKKTTFHVNLTLDSIIALGCKFSWKGQEWRKLTIFRTQNAVDSIHCFITVLLSTSVNKILKLTLPQKLKLRQNSM